jgi:hypothetical protein
MLGQFTRGATSPNAKALNEWSGSDEPTTGPHTGTRNVSSGNGRSPTIHWKAAAFAQWRVFLPIVTLYETAHFLIFCSEAAAFGPMSSLQANGPPADGVIASEVTATRSTATSNGPRQADTKISLQVTARWQGRRLRCNARRGP